MAITDITITQDNTIGDIDLLAVHNPLVFIAVVTWNTTAPEQLTVNLSDGTNTDTYNAIFLDDLSETQRRFMFVADEAIRKRLPVLEDFSQTVDTVVNVANLTQAINIEFTDDILSSSVDITACHAARDFENIKGATLIDLYNNESNYYVGGVGNDIYLYWYNDDAANQLYAGQTTNNYFTLTFNANVNASEFIKLFAARLYNTTNIKCNNTIFNEELREGIDFTAGASISDTVDNIITAMQGNSGFDCFVISKVDTDKIKLEEPTNWWTGLAKLSGSGTAADYTITKSIVNGEPAGCQIDFTSNLLDGEIVNFFYDDGINPPLVTSMTARNLPTLSTEFGIGGTASATMTNYKAAFAAEYPTIWAFLAEDTSGTFVSFQDDVNLSADFGRAAIPQTGWTFTEISAVQPTGTFTLNKGFVRKRIQPTQSGIITETLSINNVGYSHTVKVRQFCEGDRLLKFLDRNGQYRFIPFTRYYQRLSNPQPIGTINELILSLANDPSDTKEIGYKNKNTLLLSAAQLNSDERALLEDLYNSAEVYLIVDTKEVSVTVKGDNVSRLAKNNFSDLTIEVTLPQSYNVTLL